MRISQGSAQELGQEAPGAFSIKGSDKQMQGILHMELQDHFPVTLGDSLRKP